MKFKQTRSTLAGVLLVSAVATIPAPNAQAVPFCNFAPQLAYPVGTNSSKVAMGDLNNDGNLDFVALNRTGSTASIYLGDGAGSFALLQTLLVGTAPASTSPKDIAIADLNNDGNLDLVIGSSIAELISIFLGNGTGGYVSQTTISFSPGSGFAALVVGDINNDGDLDLIVAFRSSSSILALLGDGTGGFAFSQALSVGPETRSMELGDLNGDGKLDLVVTDSLTFVVVVHPGDGAGGFGAPLLFSLGVQPLASALGDIDNDGNLDLAVGIFNTSSVSVMFGNGTGFLGLPQTFPDGLQELRSIAMGDVNGDAVLDIVAVGSTVPGNGVVSVLIGDGAGSFAAPQLFQVGSIPISVAIGDIDNDGIDDLAVLNNSSNTVSILINQTVICQPTLDFNGDGVINAADLANLLANWGVYP